MILYNLPCTEVLKFHEPVDIIFADPPDNLGLNYGTYIDKIPEGVYYDWLEYVILESLRVGKVLWLSYYWKHDLELKARIRHIIKYRHPAHNVKTFIWHFTFGQHNKTDFGSDFRFIVRISRHGIVWDTDAVRIESERQRIGDKRADPEGRVPSDFWLFDVPRVTGNSNERRNWHSTQHPENLMERIYKIGPGKKILDLFAGSGTSFIVGKRLGLNVSGCEIDPYYCSKIIESTPEVKLWNTN